LGIGEFNDVILTWHWESSGVILWCHK